MQTNLYIIRHGEAVCNVDDLVGGVKGCRGLTDRGHEQVRLLAERLSQGEIKADVLYASTIRRARETAEPVAEALGAAITWDDELHELRPGSVIDGGLTSEAIERYGWVPFNQPYRPVAPGGESWATFTARACTALDNIVRQHEGQTIVVVAHGGIVEASFYLLLGLGMTTSAHAGFGTHNTSITHWQRRAERYPELDQPRWYLMRYNDVTHLAKLDK